MMETKKQALESIINANNNEIRTIQKLLQATNIKKREVREIKEQDVEFYNMLHEHCEMLVANLFELIIDRPRQAQIYLTLAKEQEALFNNLFGDNVENSLMPTIEITRDNSSTTTIDIIDDIEK